MLIWSGITNVESCFRKRHLWGGVGKGGGRAEQNSVPFETVLNFEMHFEKKKRHFRGGGVADMHLPWWWWLFLRHNVYVPENWKVIIRCSNLCIQVSQGMFLISVFRYKVMELKCLFEFIFGNILFLGDIIKSNFVVRENELL